MTEGRENMKPENGGRDAVDVGERDRWRKERSIKEPQYKEIRKEGRKVGEREEGKSMGIGRMCKRRRVKV